MKSLCLFSLLFLLASPAAMADETDGYSCRLQTAHGQYSGYGPTAAEGAREAYLLCQEDARNTKWQCYTAWMAARMSRGACHYLGD